MPTTFDSFLQTVSDKLSTLGPGIRASRPLTCALGTEDPASIRGPDKTPAIYVHLAGTGELKLVASGEKDVVAQVVAYVLVVHQDAIECEQHALDIVLGLLDGIPGERWGQPYAHPATNVESADMHGLVKGFKPDTSSWRVGVSVLARAADLYGGDDSSDHLAIWAVTWEQTLRIGTDAYTAEDGYPQPLSSRFSPITSGHYDFQWPSDDDIRSS